MTAELKSISTLMPAMRESVRKFVERVESRMGGNLHSVTLFGALAAGKLDPGQQSGRSVVVLDTMDLDALRALAGEGRALGKLHMAAPLIMTPDYVRSSLDTFPLEFLDIHQNHVTVCGEDLFAGLEFQAEPVRAQCERELKSLLVGMRQGVLNSLGRDKDLDALEFEAAENLLRTLRGLLWLNGQRDPAPQAEAIRRMEQLADRQLPGVKHALDRQHQRSWESFRELYTDIEALGDYADAR